MRGGRLTLLSVVMVFGASAAQAQYTQKEWPEGPSKTRFVATCDGCHDINRVRVGYTAEGWLTIVRMMQNMHAPVPAEEWGAMTDYLIRNFPERPRPPAAIIDGQVKANIEMWDVPTQGSRPHDPLAARDGSIWWTGQLANKLGRVDPRTGAIREYTLKSAFTGPHGLAEDQTGKIWFTGNNTALIGKLDPSTGLVTEYPLPDANAKDPHTLNFDQSGILWFTVQQANMIGRLDPATGAIRLVTSPTPKSRPYGLKINAEGTPIVVEFGTNKIASIDPKTMAIREMCCRMLPPDRDVSRSVPTGWSGTSILQAAISAGSILRPARSRSGFRPAERSRNPMASSSPRARCGTRRSAAKPNTIVRFDPATEKFQSWAIPGGGDIVRNMDVTPDGNPVIADSLTNQVGLVQIK